MKKEKTTKILDPMAYTTVKNKLYITCPVTYNRMDYLACKNRAQSPKMIFGDCNGCTHWIDVVEQYQEDILEEEKINNNQKKIIQKPLRKRIAEDYGKISTRRKRKTLHIRRPIQPC